MTRQENTMEHFETLDPRISWCAPVARLDYVSRDGRVLLDPAMDPRTRDYPLALLAQIVERETALSHGIGGVEKVYVEGSAPTPYLMARGWIDTTPLAWKVAGAVALGLMNFQLDLDAVRDDHVRVITLSDGEASGKDALQEIMTVAQWRVAGITVSASPNAWNLPAATVRFPVSYAPSDARTGHERT
jgi:hypothetical protein